MVKIQAYLFSLSLIDLKAMTASSLVLNEPKVTLMSPSLFFGNFVDLYPLFISPETSLSALTDELNAPAII